MADALIMAKDAIECWLWEAENNGEVIPIASKQFETLDNEIFILINVNTGE